MWKLETEIMEVLLVFTVLGCLIQCSFLSTAVNVPINLGCYNDKYSTALPYKPWNDSAAMDIRGCLNVCRRDNRPFAGVKDGRTCNCGNSFPNQGPAENPCDTPCSGNRDEICGGNKVLNVFTVCTNGTYKSETFYCDNKCGHCKDSLHCQHITGTCDNGCRKGWEPPMCQECTRGYYGVNCDPCGHCKNPNCNTVTGQCDTDGCLPGWQGPTCQQECSEGFFGNCSQPCGHCEMGTCNKTNGICSRCKPGWKGTYCQIACDTNEYGPNCQGTCGHCVGTCNRTDGYCHGGCSPGWQMDLCQTTCPDGFYGNCSLLCGNCANATCSKTDGECSDDGCSDGWIGEFCIEKCSNGTYGRNCSQTCAYCKDGSQCHHANGHCQGQCEDGWHGDKCDQVSNAIGAIVGGIIGVLAFLAVIGGLVFLFLRKRNINKENDEDLRNRKTNTGKEKEIHDNDGWDGYDDIEVKSEGDYDTLRIDPQYDDVGFQIKIDDLNGYIRRMKEEDGFKRQFKDIHMQMLDPCDVGKDPKNKEKNNFTNILPYDNNRVQLKDILKGKTSDYINASFINGFNMSKKYIATQSPKNTNDTFWAMVWEQDVRNIVNLLVEQDNQYWPEAGESETFGSISVQNETNPGETEHPGFVIRNMKIDLVLQEENDGIYSTADTERSVTLYHFTEWPKKGVPENGTKLLALVRKVRADSKSLEAPIVVHCSAGTGRTGTYIALDFLLDQAHAEGQIDVVTCVTTLREQRMSMVQRWDQYVFIYDTIYEAVLAGDIR